MGAQRGPEERRQPFESVHGAPSECGRVCIYNWISVCVMHICMCILRTACINVCMHVYTCVCTTFVNVFHSLYTQKREKVHLERV